MPHGFQWLIAVLDNVRVRIEGSSYALRDLAQVSIRDPQTLLVAVHDAEVSIIGGCMGGGGGCLLLSNPPPKDVANIVMYSFARQLTRASVRRVST